MAGKTAAEDESGYGIVIFKAENEQEATSIMKSDPALIHGLMKAELKEFNVALIKETNIK